MSSENQSNSSGIGFLGLLQVLFIGLKLTGYIDWSWWWVWSPFLIPWAIILVVFIVAVIVVGLAKAFA